MAPFWPLFDPSFWPLFDVCLALLFNMLAHRGRTGQGYAVLGVCTNPNLCMIHVPTAHDHFVGPPFVGMTEGCEQSPVIAWCVSRGVRTPDGVRGTAPVVGGVTALFCQTPPWHTYDVIACGILAPKSCVKWFLCTNQTPSTA